MTYAGHASTLARGRATQRKDFKRHGPALPHRTDTILTCPNPKCGREVYQGNYVDFPPQQKRYCIHCGQWWGGAVKA